MNNIGQDKNGLPIRGEKGSHAHLHETGFGTGMITVRKKGEKTFREPVDTSVRDVNEILEKFQYFPK